MRRNFLGILLQLSFKINNFIFAGLNIEFSNSFLSDELFGMMCRCWALPKSGWFVKRKNLPQSVINATFVYCVVDKFNTLLTAINCFAHNNVRPIANSNRIIRLQYMPLIWLHTPKREFCVSYLTVWWCQRNSPFWRSVLLAPYISLLWMKLNYWSNLSIINQKVFSLFVSAYGYSS